MKPTLRLAWFILIAAAFGLGGLWILHDALSDGVIRKSSRVYTRDGTPFGYWRMVVIGGVATTASIGGLLAVLVGFVWVRPAENRKIDAWIRRNDDFEQPENRSGR